MGLKGDAAGLPGRTRRPLFAITYGSLIAASLGVVPQARLLWADMNRDVRTEIEGCTSGGTIRAECIREVNRRILREAGQSYFDGLRATPPDFRDRLEDIQQARGVVRVQEGPHQRLEVLSEFIGAGATVIQSLAGRWRQSPSQATAVAMELMRAGCDVEASGPEMQRGCASVATAQTLQRLCGVDLQNGACIQRALPLLETQFRSSAASYQAAAQRQRLLTAIGQACSRSRPAPARGTCNLEQSLTMREEVRYESVDMGPVEAGRATEGQADAGGRRRGRGRQGRGQGGGGDSSAEAGGGGQLRRRQAGRTPRRESLRGQAGGTQTGSQFIESEDADGTDAGACEALIPTGADRARIARDTVGQPCPPQTNSFPELTQNPVADLGRMISSNTYLDGLRRYALRQLLGRYREHFGNDLQHRVSSDSGRCQVHTRQIPAGCLRDPEVAEQFSQELCRPVDQRRISAERARRRTPEFQRVARADAQELTTLLGRGRLLAEEEARLEGRVSSLPVIQNSPPERIREVIREVEEARRRLPEVQEQIAAVRNQILALQARSPELGRSRPESEAHADDEWYVPSIVRQIATEADPSRIASLTNQAFRNLESQMWATLGSVCDPNRVTNEDLLSSDSIVTGFMAEPANEQMFGRLHACMADRLDSRRATREGLIVATTIACGVTAFAAGMVSGGVLGFGVGLGCSLFSLDAADAQYHFASNRIQWIAQCRAAMGSQQSICSSEEYIAARQEFEDAIQELMIEGVSLAAMDLMLPGIGSGLGALRAARVRRLAEALRRASSLPAGEAGEEIRRVVAMIRRESGEAQTRILAEAGELVDADLPQGIARAGHAADDPQVPPREAPEVPAVPSPDSVPVSYSVGRGPSLTEAQVIERYRMSDTPGLVSGGRLTEAGLGVADDAAALERAGLRPREVRAFVRQSGPGVVHRMGEQIRSLELIGVSPRRIRELVGGVCGM